MAPECILVSGGGPAMVVGIGVALLLTPLVAVFAGRLLDPASASGPVGSTVVQLLIALGLVGGALAFATWRERVCLDRGGAMLVWTRSTLGLRVGVERWSFEQVDSLASGYMHSVSVSGRVEIVEAVARDGRRRLVADFVRFRERSGARAWARAIGVPYRDERREREPRRDTGSRDR